MKVKSGYSGLVAAGLAWTAGLMIAYGFPLEYFAAAWRLKAIFVLAWVLGLALLWQWAGLRGHKRAGKAEKDHAAENVDPVTGLPTRAYFRGIVQDYLDACGERDEKSLVLLICVKDLDKIAESHGDEEAERVMVRVSRALLDSLRGADLLARHDKDEMVAFLPKAASISWEAIAERILFNVAAQNNQFDKPYVISVSTGHSEFDPASPLPLELLLRHAYEEMIKELGKDQI